MAAFMVADYRKKGENVNQTRLAAMFRRRRETPSLRVFKHGSSRAEG
jgi:hypothetical protein